VKIEKFANCQPIKRKKNHLKSEKDSLKVPKEVPKRA
jgi:hypothetical protein